MGSRCWTGDRRKRAVSVAKQDGDRVAVVICDCQIQDSVPIEVSYRNGHGIASRCRTGGSSRKRAVSVAEQDGDRVAWTVGYSQIRDAVPVEVSYRYGQGIASRCRVRRVHEAEPCRPSTQSCRTQHCVSVAGVEERDCACGHRAASSTHRCRERVVARTATLCNCGCCQIESGLRYRQRCCARGAACIVGCPNKECLVAVVPDAWPELEDSRPGAGQLRRAEDMDIFAVDCRRVAEVHHPLSHQYVAGSGNRRCQCDHAARNDRAARCHCTAA